MFILRRFCFNISLIVGDFIKFMLSFNCRSFYSPINASSVDGSSVLVRFSHRFYIVQILFQSYIFIQLKFTFNLRTLYSPFGLDMVKVQLQSYVFQFRTSVEVLLQSLIFIRLRFCFNCRYFHSPNLL